MDLSYLETIGKFIGTYGLAVFLVLYYAVRLYPQMQKERDDWIRQITRLRQLVDPITRTLTRDQARTVLQLASDAFADRLRLFLDSRGSSHGSLWSNEGEVKTWLFGQELSFNLQETISAEEREQEFDNLAKGIQRSLKDQMQQYRENLDRALEFVSEMARRDAYRLALLRFSNSSLETVWRNAYDFSTRQWSEGLSNTLGHSDRYEIGELRRFVSKHPASQIKKDAIGLVLAEIRFVSGQEHATYLKTVFDHRVEEELIRIDASEEI
jgi:hypothetical protein